MTMHCSKPLRVSAAALLLAASTAHAQAVGSAQTRPSISAAAATITAADALHRLGIIAHDSMGGRDTPSPGLEMTAAYIAAQFRSFGLRPGGDSATFIQRYPYTMRRVNATVPMIEVRGATTPDMTFAQDYFIIPAEVDSVVGSPYFIGTATAGMTIPAGVRGRILVAAVPDTLGIAWQQRLSALFPAAMGAGAAGLIMILDPRVTTASVAEIARPLAEQAAPFPVFGVRADAFAAVSRAGGLDPASLFTSSPPAARDMTGVTLKLRTPAQVTDARVPNVVAILEGSDPVLKNEYVVFSAHMDHVGVGTADAGGDTIYNGADDDGSGTTAIMEIAEAYASLATPPKRSLIFLAVSGEEKGLLGSSYFTDHPPVPITHIIANINMDMIGRNNPDSVTAIGLEYSSLGPLATAVSRANPDLRLTVAPDLTPEEQLFLRSDHFSFARKDIPAIFFTTGLHGDYHKASDEISTIDTDKIARVARLAFLLGYEIAESTARPVWTPLGMNVVKAARAMSGQ